MRTHLLAVGGACAAVIWGVACSDEIEIVPEQSAASVGSTSGSSSASSGTGGSTSGGTSSVTSGSGGFSNAATSSGAGGAGPGCCATPVQIEQPVRMVTADSDPTRHVGGYFTPNGNNIKLEEGPMYLTDMSPTGTVLWLVQGTDCYVPQTMPLPNYGNNGVQAARVFIPAGTSLCASGAALFFAGFRPY
jgi:hypothetical protein